MDDGNLPFSICLFLGFIILSACLYGFGAAIQNLNITDLEQEMEAGNKKAGRLLRMINRPTAFIHTMQISIFLLGMVTGGFILKQISAFIQRRLLSQSLFFQQQQVLLAVFCRVAVTFSLLVLLLCFGAIIPKRLAARSPEKWGFALLPLVRTLNTVLLPANWLVDGICWLVLKLFGIDMNEDAENVTEEDIMSMVNEGHEQGVVEADEAQMITNIFQLNDKEACDIMTNRKNIVAISSEFTLKEAADFILKEGNNSRYPVYEKDIDDIIGILHMKDALIFADTQENQEKMIKEIPGLLRKAYFIPRTRSIDTLFKEMQAKKIHMEIVVDEYGQTEGILTMEDILEEIVGSIMDEYDEEEEFISPGKDGSFVMSGLTPLKAVQDVLEIEFAPEDMELFDTLNGFLISKLNRIPEENEQLTVNDKGYCFDLLKVENKMIHSVKVRKQRIED